MVLPTKSWMPCPSSWKSVTTSSCFRRLGFFEVGFEKLHTSAVAGYLLVPLGHRKPGWRLKLAATGLLADEIQLIGHDRRSHIQEAVLTMAILPGSWM
jgi:hypothetical protein